LHPLDAPHVQVARVQHRDGADDRDPERRRRRCTVGDGAEDRLESGASLEEVLRDERHRCGEDDHAEDEHHERPEGVQDAPRSDEHAEGVDARADREKSHRLAQPAGLRHRREEADGILHDLTPRRDEIVRREDVVGRGFHAARISAGSAGVQI
jgi:hypothetical protein